MFKFFKNYFFVFFILLLTSCNKGGGISDTTNQPIFVPQDTEMEGFLADTISDELIKYYYTLPKQAVKKHNASILSALTNSEHGKIYQWSHGEFYGYIKMVYSSDFKNYPVCRTWLEEIGRKRVQFTRYGKKSFILKNKILPNSACFDLQLKKWVAVDDGFHYKN